MNPDNSILIQQSIKSGNMKLFQDNISLIPANQVIAFQQYIFKYACECNKLQVAQWVAKKGNITPGTISSTFNSVCQKNILSAAQLLVNNYPDIDRKTNNNEAYRLAIYYGNHAVVEWLDELDG